MVKNILGQKLSELESTLSTEIEQIKQMIQTKIPPEIDLTDEFARIDLITETIRGIVPDEDLTDNEPTEPDQSVDEGIRDGVEAPVLNDEGVETPGSQFEADTGGIGFGTDL